MKVLFATALPLLPQASAGVQASADMIAQSLRDRGHEVFFLGTLTRKGALGTRGRIVQKFLKRPAVDNVLGYKVYRSVSPWEKIQWTLNKVSPDVVVVLAGRPIGMALAARKANGNIPVVIKLQDLNVDDYGVSFKDLGSVTYVANSHFTARRYRETYDVNPLVINPMIDISEYKTTSTKENITFVNPDPRKGLDIALAVAFKCSEIPFVFLEGWPLTHAERRNLEKMLETFRM